MTDSEKNLFDKTRSVLKDSFDFFHRQVMAKLKLKCKYFIEKETSLQLLVNKQKSIYVSTELHASLWVNLDAEEL